MARLPKFGIDFVGDVPWGTHLCQFYETEHDLAEILVPYFAEGLRSNEACMWVTSEPLGVEEATAALARAVPSVKQLNKSGQLLILSYQEWYLKGGVFDADRILQGWVEKEHEALSRGFKGLRLSGNTFWIERNLWDRFADYEELVNNVIGAHQMIALCTYDLSKCTGSDVVDVVRNHGGTIIKQGKAWTVIEDVERRKEAELALQEAHQEVRALNERLGSTNEELLIANEELEERVQERSEELAAMNEELRVANEWLQSANDDLRQQAARRANAEQKARAASLYARSLLDASLDPLVTISAEGKITDANRATAEVTGCSHDELIGSDFSDYFTEPQVARRGYRQVFDYGFVKDYPLAIRHKLGTVTDVLYNATVYRDEAGKVQGVFAAARDVTALKRAQRELQRYSGHLEALVEERTAQLAKSEAEFRTLFEASAVGQIRYDMDGRPIRMNKAMAALLGVRDVAELHPLTIFSSPQVSQEVKEQLEAGCPTHYEQIYDFRAIAEAGHFPTTRLDVRYFDVHMLPIFSALEKTVEGYLAQYVDVTERKEAEAALKNAERLAGIGETAAMIGHDLRNPLQGLQYIVDLHKLRFDRIPPYKRSAKDWENEAQLFSRISEQIFYMDKIVGDLQDYARPIAPERQVVKVSTLADDVIASLPQSDHVTIVTDVGDVVVTVDPHLMHRAFANLILNAIQAMPEGGTLTISAAAEDGSVAISVSDTGIGISDGMKPKLFSPLTTGKAKGTGLGLAVVKRIVEAHGGTISFESEEGKGTTFTVALPVSKAS